MISTIFFSTGIVDCHWICLFAVFPVSDGNRINSSAPVVVTMASQSIQDQLQNAQITAIQPPVTTNLNEISSNLPTGGENVTVQHYLLTSIVTNSSTGKQTSQLITQPIILPQSDSGSSQNMVLVPNLNVPVELLPLNSQVGLVSSGSPVKVMPGNSGDMSVGVPVQVGVPGSNVVLTPGSDGIATVGMPVSIAGSNSSVVVSKSSLMSDVRSVQVINGIEGPSVSKTLETTGSSSFVDSGLAGEYITFPLVQTQSLDDVVSNQTLIDTSSKGLPSQTILDSNTLQDMRLLSDDAQDSKMNVISLTDLLTPIDMSNFSDAASVDKEQGYTEMNDQSVDVREFLSEAVSKELSQALEESNGNVPLIENE